MKMTRWIRLICLLLALVMTVSLFGCNGSKKDPVASSDTAETPSDAEASSEPEETEESGDDTWDETEEEEEAEDYSEYINEIRVYNSEEPKQNGFLGLNAIYHLYPYLEVSDGRTYTKKQIDLEFSRVEQTGVKIVRSYYDTTYAYDRNAGKFNWESDDMKGIYKWANRLQDMDIDIALNAGWEMSIFYEDDADATGIWDYFRGVFVEGDPERSAKNYANWMVNTVNQFKAHGANNVKYLLLFTEPGGFNAVRTQEKYQTMSVYDIEDPKFDTWLRLTKALDGALKADGIREDYQLVGPNEAHQWTSDVDGTRFMPMFYNALTQANDYIDIYSHHNYLTAVEMISDVVVDQVDLYWGERADLAKEVTGKPFWIDEGGIRNKQDDTPGGGFSNTEWHAVQVAQMMTRSMSRGIQNIMLWSLADQNWGNNSTNADGFYNGVQQSGIFPSVYLSAVPYKSYYGTSLLMKYFGKGGSVYPVEEAMMMYASCEEKDGKWTVLVVNSGFEDAEFKLSFDEGIGNKTFYRYMYDPNTQVATAEAKPIGADRAFRSDDGTFRDSLKPFSFAVYTTVKPE